MFVLYLAIVLSEVVRMATFGQIRFDFVSSGYQSHTIFSDGFDLIDLLNIIFFIPFDVTLTVMCKLFDWLVPTLIIGMFFSDVIEFAQLFMLYRVTDINDLIMNTLGTIIGWLLVKDMFKWWYQRKQQM